MAATTSTAFEVATLDDFERRPANDGRIPINVRRHFGILGFGVRVNIAEGEGHVVGEHNEVGPGASEQEELYLVLSGAATFTVNGEEMSAPAGTFVFVRDPAATRSAVAHEEGTRVLALGGTPGRAYRIPIGELMNGMWEPYRAGDYEAALAALQPALAERPESLVLFNVACMEALTGRADDALEHLRRSIDADSRILEHVRTDSDLDSLRDDPRFAELVA
jgi:tetratricopeptide (TPR) repeat protein